MMFLFLCLLTSFTGQQSGNGERKLRSLVLPENVAKWQINKVKMPLRALGGKSAVKLKVTMSHFCCYFMLFFL